MEFRADTTHANTAINPFWKQYRLFHAAWAQICYTGAQIAIAGETKLLHADILPLMNIRLFHKLRHRNPSEHQQRSRSQTSRRSPSLLRHRTFRWRRANEIHPPTKSLPLLHNDVHSLRCTCDHSTRRYRRSDALLHTLF